MRQTLPPILAIAVLTALAACTSERGSFRHGGGAPPPQAAPALTPPPTDMAGRWTLSAVGGSTCGIGLSGGQAAEGTIRPEGGCPGDFYTARRWTFEGGSLVIRDHNSTPLGNLRMASPNSFQGQSSAGQQLTLTR